MKEDKLFVQEALGYLDPELLEESEKTMGKKRRPAPVRALMVAACVCALLAVGAVAAEVTGTDVVESIKATLGIQVTEILTREDEEYGEMTGWGIRGSVKPEHLSEAFLADVQSVPLNEQDVGVSIGALYKDFYSREEMENYLGLTLADNPMLEGNGRDWRIAVSISQGKSEQKDLYIDLFETAKIELSESGEQRPVFVYLEAWTSTWGEDASIGTWFDNVAESTQERYVTPNGLETTISKLYMEPVMDEDGAEEYHQIRCIADFHLNGLNYRLTIFEPLEREELAGEVMKQILDAYQ